MHFHIEKMYNYSSSESLACNTNITSYPTSDERLHFRNGIKNTFVGSTNAHILKSYTLLGEGVLDTTLRDKAGV
jgi:hypothetical protein